jgi:hypothetical protein
MGWLNYAAEKMPVMDGVDMYNDETLGEKDDRDNTHDFSTGGMNVSVVPGVNETK